MEGREYEWTDLRETERGRRWFYWWLHLLFKTGSSGNPPSVMQYTSNKSFPAFDIRRCPLFSNSHWLYHPKGANFNEMCLFSFFFFILLDGIKALFQGPLEKQMVSLLKAYGSGARVVKIKKRPHDLCAIWFPVQLQEEQKKNWLALQRRIVRCFDKQASSLQMKEMCHLFRNSPSFHHFVCPSAAAFVSPAASEVVFEGQRASLYFSVSLVFSLCHSSYSQSAAWPLSLFSHKKKLWVTKIVLSTSLGGGKGSHIWVGHICCNLFWAFTHRLYK